MSLKHDNYIKVRKNVTIFLEKKIKMKLSNICISSFCSSSNQKTLNKKLIKAAYNGNRKRSRSNIYEVEKLLKQGADVNAKDKYGRAALHLAAFWGFADIVKLLLDKGAEVNATDNTGRTALHWAAFWGFADIVEALVIAGANLNAKDFAGRTALQLAAFDGSADIVQALVIAGADLTDNDGLTALDFVFPRNYSNIENAIEAGKNELIKLHQDKLNKYQKKQDQLPGYIKFVLKQSLEGTSAVTRTIVQFIEKPLSKSQKEQAKKYIEEREAAAAASAAAAGSALAAAASSAAAALAASSSAAAAAALAATTLQTMARGNQGRK